jgi:hypothetical protein
MKGIGIALLVLIAVSAGCVWMETTKEGECHKAREQSKYAPVFYCKEESKPALPVSKPESGTTIPTAPAK